MSNIKTVAEWEKEKGFIILNTGNLNKKITEEEFNNIPWTEKHGVNHTDRIKFLQENGYEVTRENMVDPNLSARGSEDNGK